MKHSHPFFLVMVILTLLRVSKCPAIVHSQRIEGERIQFKSGPDLFSGKLFLPPGEGPYPAMVILHGGSSNVKAHRATSSYYAQKCASKGIAALIFDKRGTGESGGKVSESTFDDSINDAISAVQFLKARDKINPDKIGILGPSQGGRIAALAAARSPEINFIATMAAPLVSVADQCFFSSMEFLGRMEISDVDKEKVVPIWKKHYALIQNSDIEGLKALDQEIEHCYSKVDTHFLPLKSEKLDHLADWGMGDFQPMYNSMQNDYISELSKVLIPWISIYGEFDQAVPVETSIRIMNEQLAKGSNRSYEVKVIPDVGHGFRNIKIKKYYPVEDLIIDWILKVSPLP